MNLWLLTSSLLHLIIRIRENWSYFVNPLYYNFILQRFKKLKPDELDKESKMYIII